MYCLILCNLFLSRKYLLLKHVLPFRAWWQGKSKCRVKLAKLLCKCLSSTVSVLCVSRCFTLHGHWEMQLFDSRMAERFVNVKHEHVWMVLVSYLYTAYTCGCDKAAGDRQQSRHSLPWVGCTVVLRGKWGPSFFSALLWLVSPPAPPVPL